MNGCRCEFRTSWSHRTEHSLADAPHRRRDDEHLDAADHGRCLEPGHRLRRSVHPDSRNVSWSHDSRHIYAAVAERQTDVVLLAGLL